MNDVLDDRSKELNPIDRLSERLESIRFVHSMAIIGAEAEKSRRLGIKASLVERLEDLRLKGQDGSPILCEMGNAERSLEANENEIEENDTLLLKLEEVAANSRINYAISMVSAFEAFLGETLSMAFHRCPLCMKNSSTTLNDDMLVEAIIGGNVLDALVAARVRRVMSEHLMKCGETMGILLGIDTSRIKELKELVLVRNCLVHNDCRPSPELLAAFHEYVPGRRITPEKEWLEGNHRTIFEISNDIWVNVHEKIIQD